MKLKIVGSSSDGNCYLLSSATETLIIECGVHIKRIKQALDFNLMNVVACLISHNHQDHCKAVKEIMKAGINVHASTGTLEVLGLIGNHRARYIEAKKQFKVGRFTITPFDIKHDAAEPLGFMIHHSESGHILFLTDTCYSKYTFPNLNNIIIEANYAQDIMDDRATVIRPVREHVLDSHMSIETCKELLLANDLSNVNNIVLIHLSNGHSDEVRFKKEVEQCTGKTVHVARAGMTIDPFNKTPF